MVPVQDIISKRVVISVWWLIKQAYSGLRTKLMLFLLQCRHNCNDYVVSFYSAWLTGGLNRAILTNAIWLRFQMMGLDESLWPLATKSRKVVKNEMGAVKNGQMSVLWLNYHLVFSLLFKMSSELGFALE